MFVVRRVVGSSMKPALFEGDIVIGLRHKRPRVGDIVIAKQRGREVIKRVDSIKKKKYYLVGDNKRASTDSRHHGPVTKKSLVAVALFALNLRGLKKPWVQALAVGASLTVLVAGLVFWNQTRSSNLNSATTKAPVAIQPQKTEVRPQYEVAAVRRDIPYCNNQALDLYYPTKAVFEKAPVIVFLHGGGWEVNDKASEVNVMNDFLGRLRDKGYALASIDYRKLPDFSYPSPVQDALCSVRFLRAEHANLGIDSSRIGMFGFSSGGHLAAMVGVLDSTNPLTEGQQYTNESSRLKAVVVLAGLLDLSDGLRDNNILRLRYFLKQADWLSASPATYATKDDPPFLLLHGMKDQFIDPVQDSLFSRKLQEVGVKNEVVHIENANHFLNEDGGQMNVSREEVVQRITNFMLQNL